MTKKKAVWIDLDGTLANIDHRLHHIQGSEKNWDAFFNGIRFDRLNDWCAKLILGQRMIGCEIVYVTGRDDRYEDVSRKWLNDKLGAISFNDPLHMRKFGDKRPDYEYKAEIYQKLSQYWDFVFGVEDRPTVAKALREAGLVVLLVDNFEI